MSRFPFRGSRFPFPLLFPFQPGIPARRLVAAALLLLLFPPPAGARPGGDFQTSIAIEVPPFRGLEPNLHLAYSSDSGTGWAGAGWGLGGVSAVQRLSATRGVPAFADDDIYLLDGLELLPCTPSMESPSCRFPAEAGLQAYVTKIESFQRIAYDKASISWRVWSRNGLQLTYSPGLVLTGDRIASWTLREVADPRGNRVHYDYWVDEGSGFLRYDTVYLDAIRYGGTVVKFHSERRPDTVTRANGAGLSAMRYRLKTIDVQVDGERARAYGLTYRTLPQSAVQRSILERVQRFGSDATVDAAGHVSGGSSLPPTVIEVNDGGDAGTWTTGDAGLLWGGPDGTQARSYHDPFGPWEPNAYTGSFQFTASRWLSGDLNGDRRQDLVHVFVRGSRIVATTALARDGDVATKWQRTWHHEPSDVNDNYRNYQWFAADANGDGLTDVVGTLPSGFVVLESNGDGTLSSQLYRANRIAASIQIDQGGFLLGLGSVPGGGLSANFSYVQARMYDHWLAGDVNGDGRTDLLMVHHDGQVPGSAQLCPVLFTGSGVDVSQPCQPTFWAWNDVETTASRFLAGDVDGDGKMDVVMVSDQSRVAIARSRGDGTFLLSAQETGLPWQEESFWFTGDVDADGRTDLMQVGRAGDHAALKTWRANATGTVFTSSPPFYTDLDWDLVDPCLGSSKPGIWFPGDVDGDGRTDFMHLRHNGGFPCPSPPRFPLSLELVSALSRPTGAYELTAGRPVGTWLTGSQMSFVTTDENADGATDLVFAQAEWCTTEEGTTVCLPTAYPIPSVQSPLWHLRHHLAAGRGQDPRRMMAGDVTGDGQVDWVHVAHAGGKAQVTTVASGGFAFPAGQTFDLGLPDSASWFLADADADGRLDLVRLDAEVPCNVVPLETPVTLGRHCQPAPASGLRLDVLRASGDGTWQPQPTFRWATSIQDSRRFKVVDTDADGRADLVRLQVSRSGGDANARLLTLTSTASGWQVRSADVLLADSAAPEGVGDSEGWRPADVDGDGRGDLVHLSRRPSGLRIRTLRPAGDGGWTAGIDDGSLDGIGWGDTAAWKVADVNGDGATDLLRLSLYDQGMQIYTAFSTGDGGFDFLRSQSWSRGVGSLWNLMNDLPNWRVLHVNGDQRADLVHLVLTAGGVQIEQLLSLDDGWWRPVIASVPLTVPETASWQAADLLGDGSQDLVRFDYGRSPTWPFPSITSLRSTTRRQLLTGLTGEAGGRVTVAYEPSTRWLATPSPAPCGLPAGAILQTVAEVAVSDGRGSPPDRRIYSYGCPRWSYSERSFLGWEEVASSRAASDGREAQVTAERYLLTDPCLVQEASSRVSSLGDAVSSARRTEYLDPGPLPPYRCEPTAVAETRIEREAQPLVVRTTFAYDGFGNLTERAELGSASEGDQERLVRRQYHAATGPYLVSLPRLEEIFETRLGAPAGPAKGRTFYCYDGDLSAECTAAPVRGLLTAVHAWDNVEGTYATTRFHHDAYGNVIRTTDAEGETSTTTYDSVHHLFPETSCNALGHCSEQRWSFPLGRIVYARDVNRGETTYDFDALGRIAATTKPTGARTRYEYLDWGDPQRQRQRIIVDDGSADGLWTELFYDGLERVYLSRRKGGGAGEVIVQETRYADAGALQRWETLPYLEAEGPGPAEGFEYDALGRLVRQVHGDGSDLRWAYGNNPIQTWVTVTDELGRQRTTFFDPFGRRQGVRVRSGGRDQWNNFEYDVLDQLTRKSDAGGNVTTVNYDSLGRRRGFYDPDRGQTTSTYDRLGRLIAEVDARGLRTEIRYDALGRPTRKQVDVPKGPEVLYRYDEPGHGASVGRLTSVVEPTAEGCPGGVGARYSYVVSGQVSRLERCILGKTYVFEFSYDSLGRQVSMTYPDGERVETSYDEAGRPSGLGGYVHALRYAPSGQIAGVQLANAVEHAYAYDGKRSWLTEARVSKGGEELFHLAHPVHAPNGLILESSSRTHRSNLRLSYDDLDRLVQVSGDEEQELAYDAIGNITFNSRLGSYSYCDTAPPCAQPHAVRKAGDRTFAYDATGNMTSRNGLEVRWNAENRREWSELPDRSWLHAGYDAAGRRVLLEELDGPDADPESARRRAFFVDPWIEDSAEGGLVKYYHLAGTLVARRDSTGVYWYHRDHLGSTRLVTDHEGRPAERYEYSPFGEQTSPPSNPAFANSIRFTGHRSEEPSGLIHMNARDYDPQLGRFLSADNATPDPFAPEAFNRYSYVYNNPLLYTDPTGSTPELVPTWTVSREQWVTESGQFGEDIVITPASTYVPPPEPLTPFEQDLRDAKASVYAIWTMLTTYYEIADAVTTPYQVVAGVGGLRQVERISVAELNAIAKGSQIAASRSAHIARGRALAAANIVDVDPKTLRWTQTSAGGKGRAQELHASMTEKGWAGDPIDVVWTEDGLVTVDHTRARVALELGMEKIPVRVHLADEPLPPEMLTRPWNHKKQTATTWGEAAALRAAGQSPPLPPTGTAKPPKLRW